MLGRHIIDIQSKHLVYRLEIKRKVTVIQGDSGTGKTTLASKLVDALRDEAVKLVSDVPCKVITTETDWALTLKNTRDTVVFIDEDMTFLKGWKFPQMVTRSSCYFVLITREPLKLIPYSVTEIYKLESKFDNQTAVYTSPTALVYSRSSVNSAHPDCLLVEDKGSGAQFFSELVGSSNCVSAEGATNISKRIRELSSRNLLVIADGAAFGAFMLETIEAMISAKEKIAILLPESFEWLLLKSGLSMFEAYKDQIEHPERYAEAKEFLSWENYFTWVLIEATKGMEDFEYSKKELPSGFKTKEVKNEILAVLRNFYSNLKLVSDDGKFVDTLEEVD